MSLPLPALERLFVRLQATYGRDFMSRYEGVDINAVKTSWAHELSGYRKNMMPLAWALENLPERCPNVLEFRALCRRAPAADLPALPEPAADPARVAAELAKLAPLRAKSAYRPIDHKAWARAIVDRANHGQQISIYSLNLARSALGLSAETEAA